MLDILSELDGKEYTEEIYKDYDIRLCRENEYEDMRSFLKKYWKDKHIFVLSKELFDFQHLNKRTHEYNFIIAREKSTNDIHAILGFVPTNQYDEDIERLMVWPCIWKNRKDVNRKGLGVTMYYHLKNMFNIETISILGISEVALSIYKHWNFTSGKIQQFAMPNVLVYREQLSCGLLKHYKTSFEDNEEKYVLQRMNLDEYNLLEEQNPIYKVNSIYKSKKFYINRYFNHPTYKYIFYAVKLENVVKSIMICRVCGDGNTNCIRIVDYIGEIRYLKEVRCQIQTLLQENEYEYIDLVEVGLDSSEIRKAGFINRTDYDDVIIPNYFEPFLKQNIDLDYAYKTIVDDSKEVFFKADADQDRPNLL